jgi:hypothetical protein
MILPERVLGRPGAHCRTSGRSNRADFLADVGDQFLAQRLGRFDADFQGDIGVNTLTLDVVREADHGRFGDRRMQHQRRFDLGGAHAVTGHVDHIVHPPGDPVIAVLIAAGAVAGEVQPLVHREVGFDKARVIAVHGAHDPRPGAGDHQITVGGAFQELAFSIDQAPGRRRRMAGWRNRVSAASRRAVG